MNEAIMYELAGLAAHHRLAAAAGRDVLIEGGNVVEAALAAVAVAAVVAPERNGLGGDALWLVREAGPRGRVRVLDARGPTGALARPARLRDLGFDTVPARGAEAVLAAPGVVAGWAEALALAHAFGGRLPLARLLEPAIAAARDGVDVTEREAAALAATAPALAPEPGFAASFLAGTKPPAAGSRRRLPALAATLDYLARSGLGDFYRGDVGRELAADLVTLGCPLDRDDLRRTAARWRPPATLDLGRESLDVAPSGAGIAAALALGLFALGAPVRDDGGRFHALIESVGQAQDLAAPRPTAEGLALLDPDRLARAAKRIDRSRAGPRTPRPAPFAEHAAAISAVDRDGAAVAVVSSLGSAWGAGLVSLRTGILLGNRAAAFALDAGARSTLAPQRRAPLRSTPALLSGRDGRVASLWAAGPHGPAVAAQVMARLVAGASSAEAVDAPRFALGAAPDGTPAVLVETDREPDSAGRLRAMGHLLLPHGAADLRAAGVVARLPSGRIEAVADGDEIAVDGV